MFGDPEINQHGFDKVTVNDVCTAIVRGPFGSALKKDFFVEKSSKTYKVYEQKHAIQKSATIGTYYIDETKFKELKRFECKPGDFLMSCSGTMGELYQLPADCERGIINQAIFARYPGTPTDWPESPLGSSYNTQKKSSPQAGALPAWGEPL